MQTRHFDPSSILGSMLSASRTKLTLDLCSCIAISRPMRRASSGTDPALPNTSEGSAQSEIAPEPFRQFRTSQCRLSRLFSKIASIAQCIPFPPFPQLVILSIRLHTRSSNWLQLRDARRLHCLFMQSILPTIHPHCSLRHFGSSGTSCQPSVTSTPLFL